MEQPISPLVAQVITASFEMTRQTSDRLIESLTTQNADLCAELDAVRAGIGALLDGPYQPSGAAIYRAMYPSPDFVDLFREAGA